MLAQHFVLEVFGTLKRHFGSLLKKLLFLGRTLLLRLWVLGRTFGSGLGGLESSQSSWNLCWCRNVGSRASKPVLVQEVGSRAKPRWRNISCSGCLRTL